jgi:hypothetical protein
MHGTPSIKLGSSKHGPCKKIGFQPPTFKAESRMLRVNKFVLGHIENCSIPKVGNKD